MNGPHELTGERRRELAERHAWASDLRRALRLLPEPQRQVLHLAYVERLTQVEIANQLAVPLGTVKTCAARGLQRLAALLDDREATGDRAPW